MGFYYSPKIVTDGLVMYVDAANPKSYPGSGTTWYDVSGNGRHFTLDGSGITWNSAGYFSLADGGATYADNITDSTACTFVFWMRTADLQSLWWKAVGTTVNYLGAYRSGNKEYYNGFGTGIEFHMDTTQPANIYDHLPDGNWHMVEFKNVDMSGIDTNEFNKYSSYTFGDGAIRSIMLYDRNITPEESLQNYNALKGRFGI
jgi:hypothetical protein